jgi:hypothetical protein
MGYEDDYSQEWQPSAQARRKPGQSPASSPGFTPDFPSPQSDQPPAPERPDLTPLLAAFRDQLLACLAECAAGRRGLFASSDHLGEAAPHRPWPEAEQLRQLAFALQAIQAQDQQSDPLVEQFLDLCSIHGESDPGEPKLARAFLTEIENQVSNKPRSI